MCGIAIVGGRGRRTERSEIEAMTRAIAHRGPDGSGTRLRDGVARGHRRLAIIDRATGPQPRSNEDESGVITRNGALGPTRNTAGVLWQFLALDLWLAPNPTIDFG
jgi:asparagine synthase (glutamine-hydrolysing)